MRASIVVDVGVRQVDPQEVDPPVGEPADHVRFVR